MTCEQLADALGVTPRTVHYWEDGKVPYRRNRTAISELFGGIPE